VESEFDAAFVKQGKAFRPKHLCPGCWVRRNNRSGSWFLLSILVAGVGAFILHQIHPGALAGRLLLELSLVGLFLILAILPHELGHAIAARALGWNVHQIVIGLGRPLFKWRCLGILLDVRAIPIAGATWMTPKDTRWFRVKRFLAVLAGPAVNAGLALAVIFIWQGGLDRFEFDALPIGPRLFLLANAMVAITNLLPYQPKTGFALASDGKQLLQTLSFSKDATRKSHAMRYTMEATICWQQSDVAGIRKWCDQGLALYPEDPHLLNLSGLAHLSDRDYAKAREVFEKLLALENQSAGIRFMFLNNLAYADVLSENPAWLPEADAYSRDAYQALPWSPAIAGTRGTVLVAIGKVEEGVELLKKSLKDAESPRSKAENSCHLSIAFAKTGNRDEARKYLELAGQFDAKCELLNRARQTMASSQAEARS
jgi:hypothetical protein